MNPLIKIIVEAVDLEQRHKHSDPNMVSPVLAKERERLSNAFREALFKEVQDFIHPK